MILGGEGDSWYFSTEIHFLSGKKSVSLVLVVCSRGHNVKETNSYAPVHADMWVRVLHMYLKCCMYVRWLTSIWIKMCALTAICKTWCCDAINSVAACCSWRKKVKLSRYRPGRALGVTGGWGFRISRHSAHEGDKFVSPTHRPSLSPRRIPGTHFC